MHPKSLWGRLLTCGRLSIGLPLTFLLTVSIAHTQTSPAAQAGRAWRTAHEQAILAEFMTFLAKPNLARDTENIRKNAAAVSAMFEKRGVKTRLLEVPGAPPVVFGEIPSPTPSAPSPSMRTMTASRSTPRNGPLPRGSRC